ncbi:MAG: hypothetical protein C5B43_01340 [Verrucomicrobia bacterium]|nr:MAG: hypothetical protein C5B43_01340 [Verrucomicrobiota bacterium]
MIFPRSGGASLTFPVLEGDNCLLLFSERSMDLWLTVGGQVTPDDPRKFDISDAIAIVGLYPFSVESPSENNTDVLLKYKDSKIRIKESGDIVIQTSNKVAIGTSSAEVLDLLYQLMNLLTGTTNVMGPTLNGPMNPLFVASVNTLITSLNSIKGTIP